MKSDKRILFPFVLALLAMACALPTLVPTPEAPPLPSPSPTWTLLPQFSATPEVTLTATDPPVSPTATLTAVKPTDTETVEIEATATAFVCANAPVTRMNVGDYARVTFTDGTPLRVRRRPVVGVDNVLVQLPEGATFTVIGGPRCAPIPDTDRSFIFWKIEIESSGEDGWVAEGDSGSYYIEPVP